jgi:hypothetical protein
MCNPGPDETVNEIGDPSIIENPDERITTSACHLKLIFGLIDKLFDCPLSQEVSRWLSIEKKPVSRFDLVQCSAGITGIEFNVIAFRRCDAPFPRHAAYEAGELIVARIAASLADGSPDAAPTHFFIRIWVRLAPRQLLDVLAWLFLKQGRNEVGGFHRWDFQVHRVINSGTLDHWAQCI